MESRGLMAVNKSTVHGLARVLVGFMTVWLVACGGGGGGNGAPRVVEEPVVAISGRVALVDQSLEGAKISLGRIDVTRSPATQNVKGKVIPLENSDQPPVVGAGGDISFQAPAAAVQDDQLFSVAVTCEPVNERCPYKMPLHAVMSGARLKQGDWNVNITTEIAYQRLAYYVAARFSEADLKQEMDTTAKLLLKADVDGSGGIDYEDLVRWDPKLDQNGGDLLKPEQLSEVERRLISDEDINAVQVLVQRMLAPALGSLALSGRGYDFKIQDDIAYIDSTDGIQIVDAHDPMNPALIASLLNGQSVSDFVISGQYLFIVSFMEFHAVDVSDPRSPKIVTYFNRMHDAAYGISIHENLAYMCSGVNGIQVADISEPSIPRFLDKLDIPCESLQIKNDLMYVIAPWEGGDFHELRILKIGQDQSVQQVSYLKTDAYVRELYVDGESVCVLESIQDPYIDNPHAGASRLSVIDFGDFSNPRYIGSVDLERHSIYRDVQCSGDHVYVLRMDRVEVFRLQEFSAPLLVAAVDVDFNGVRFEANNIGVNSDYIYLSGDEGFQVLANFEKGTPSVGRVVLGKEVSTLAVNDEKLFVAMSDGTLDVFGLEDPGRPVFQYEIDVDEDVDELNFVGEALYLSSMILDMSVPSLSFDTKALDLKIPFDQWQAMALPELSLDVFLFFFSFDGDKAYSSGMTGLTFYDLSNPLLPSVLSQASIGAPYSPGRLRVSGQTIYLRGVGYIQAYDIADPSIPRPQSRLALGSPDFGIGEFELFGGYAVVAADSDGVAIVDVRNPEQLRLVSKIDVGGESYLLRVNGSYLYVPVSEREIAVLDISLPERPQIVGSFRTAGSLVNFAVGQSHLYLATAAGIEILPLLPPN